MAAGPASYGMTDTMGRMHSDAQFAGSSSVPAHVEMMGLIGMGNNPMVGASVAVAVAVSGYDEVNRPLGGYGDMVKFLYRRRCGTGRHEQISFFFPQRRHGQIFCTVAVAVQEGMTK